MRRIGSRVKLPYKYGYPGDGYHYVQCDICGKKIRAKDAQIISDKFSDKANLLVCGDDFDKTNPQQYIRAFKERQIAHPRYIRSEGTDSFQVNANDDRVPSAPRHVQTLGGNTDGVELQWLGPEDVGSSAITGYHIKRSLPCGSVLDTVISNTGNTATYYLDTSADSTEEYGYAVAAINGAGTGPFSEEACYPPTQILPVQPYFITIDLKTLSDDGETFYLARQ